MRCPSQGPFPSSQQMDLVISHETHEFPVASSLGTNHTKQPHTRAFPHPSGPRVFVLKPSGCTSIRAIWGPDQPQNPLQLRAGGPKKGFSIIPHP